MLRWGLSSELLLPSLDLAFLMDTRLAGFSSRDVPPAIVVETAEV
jgi:hypothetical protein